MNEEELAERAIRLPQKAWDVIEKEAAKCGRTFEEEAQWLLTADFSITREQVERMDKIRRETLTKEQYEELMRREEMLSRANL